MNKIVGHYEILQKLGEGGMGVVYKARDLRLDRIVALKMLSGERLDSVQRERLIREARTASALNHPNIVTIYEIDDADGVQLVAMEYVPGKSLGELIRPGVTRCRRVRDAGLGAPVDHPRTRLPARRRHVQDGGVDDRVYGRIDQGEGAGLPGVGDRHLGGDRALVEEEEPLHLARPADRLRLHRALHVRRRAGA